MTAPISPAVLRPLAQEDAGVIAGWAADRAFCRHADLHGDESHRRELGFLIGERRLWGRGLGLLAAVAGLHHGFAQLGLEEIWAEALDANQRSVRILQRLGFEETGRGEEESFLDRASYYRRFAITADAWERATA